MITTEALIAVATHARNQTLKLVADLTDDQLSAQPAPKTNHAAWVLGHLLLAEHNLLHFLDPSYAIPAYVDEDYKAAHWMKSTPVAEKSKYKSKQFYVDELTKVRPALIETLKAVKPEVLAGPHPDPGRRERFPTLGQYVLYLLTWHESYHSGQVSAWRRVQGLPPV